MRDRAIPALALVALLFTASIARADDIILKDGSKITGTIVGLENDSFRVETSYGFALIKKDKIADITIAPSKKESEPKSKLNAPSTPQSGAQPSPEASADSASSVSSGAAMPSPKHSGAPTSEATPAALKDSSAPTKSAAAANAATKDRNKGAANAPAANAKIVPTSSKEAIAGGHALEPTSTTAKMPTAGALPAAAASSSAIAPAHSPTPATATAAAPAPPATPPAPPEPPVIRDEIRGNLYANLTFGFQMYKAPSWDLIPDARKALPDAIAALGTYDQTTLLVIGREQTKDSLEAHAAATGKTLSGVYENYRLISTKHVTIAGLPAIEQRARGTAADRDWSVVLLTFLKGNSAFTLLGMTWADSDLIQVQENVLTKSINSLTFTVQ